MLQVTQHKHSLFGTEWINVGKYCNNIYTTLTKNTADYSLWNEILGWRTPCTQKHGNIIKMMESIIKFPVITTTNRFKFRLHMLICICVLFIHCNLLQCYNVNYCMHIRYCFPRKYQRLKWYHWRFIWSGCDGNQLNFHTHTVNIYIHHNSPT